MGKPSCSSKIYDVWRGLQRFTIGSHTLEEKGDWLPALDPAPNSREKPRGSGACPLFPGATRV